MTHQRFSPELEAFFNEAVSQGVPGITCSVATQDGIVWTGAFGVADVETGEALTTDMLLGIGSITKTFVAVVILQLIEARHLRSDDTAAKVLGAAVAGIANAGLATIEQLLNHTSGVPSWEDDPEWIRDGRGVALDVNRLWGKTDALKYIKGHPPVAQAGEKYSYSNTNYTLLGMIIEKVVGGDVFEEIRRRILRPLGLTDIYLEGFEMVPQNRMPHRYHWATPQFRRDAGIHPSFREVCPTLIDASCSNLSVEWAAGGMVTTARDLALYGAALRDGKLLKPQSMRFMKEWTATGKTFQIGHGLFREERNSGRALIGFNGGVLGFSSTLYWFEGVDAVLAAMCNVGTMHSGDGVAKVDSIVKSEVFLATLVKSISGRLHRSSTTRIITLPSFIERPLRLKTPLLWLNSQWRPVRQARAASKFSLDDVHNASWKLEQFAPLLGKLFAELEASGGIIESPLYSADNLQKSIMSGGRRRGRWLIKGDHALPVGGSIKARGGIYEVLLHAEDLALQAGIMKFEDDRSVLASAEARVLFGRHEIAVGSTGNLGLSIGIMAAALGFQATVHMSADAKEWKKARLRVRGVEVVEHAGDVGSAAAAGYAQAMQNPRAYFIDDEHSERLFLGYSVAALRLQQQLVALGISVDAQHPLFVYLPCGVGGGPGGVTFGLRYLCGDHVHCFFAEPVASPCMLVQLASADDRPISVRDVGLSDRTEADGLAVAQASRFVAPLMRSLVSGIFTVPDQQLFEDLYRLEQSEGLRIEPSAAAAIRGPRWLEESEQGRKYIDEHGISEDMHRATHILWATGGAFVPEEEYWQFHERGRLAATAE